MLALMGSMPGMVLRCLFRASATLVLTSLVLNAQLRADGEPEFLAGASRTCPRCSLERAPLKRRDSSGADLSD
jgi:hypothetical protein